MKWFLGVLLLLAAALVLESGLLAYAMYVLLGLLIVSRLLARGGLAGLGAHRDELPSATAEIGDQIPVKVTVRNPSWLPVPWILLEDVLPKDALNKRFQRLKVRGKRAKLCAIRGRKEATVEYRLECMGRGFFQIGPLVMETGDLFGLHRRHRVEAKPKYLLVYPRVVPLLGYELASRRPVGDLQLTHRLFEDPTRINGIRAYEAGDPLNRVHWRATARTGQLHSKKYEPSALAGATIVLDFHRQSYHRQGEPVRSELAVTAAASLANAVQTLGQQVGLITNAADAAARIRAHVDLGEQADRLAARAAAAQETTSARLQPLIVPTRRAAEQFEQIREMLARVELTEGLMLPELLSEATGRLPRDATVLAILADVPVATALALGHLRRSGWSVTVVLIAFDEGELQAGFARLLAEGIRDVRHLTNEAALPELCRQQVERTTAYALAAE
jgi:uncharacterized protein (DUF58 family)